MFTRLENSWNSHTPVYLHPRTKENLIFQLALTVVVVGSMIVYEELKERREFPSMYENKKKSKKK